MNKQTYGMLVAADGVISLGIYAFLWQYLPDMPLRLVAGMALLGSFVATAFFLKTQIKN